MRNNKKRSEWLRFRAAHPTSADWKDVYKWIKNPKSAFHNEVKWKREEIEEEYYRKSCLNLLMRCDRIYCNTETSYQRLHMTYDSAELAKGKRKRVARTVVAIAKDKVELSVVKEAIWQRLRRVTSDMHEWRNHLPEFKEIYDFLAPRVCSQMTEGDEQTGAAAH